MYSLIGVVVLLIVCVLWWRYRLRGAVAHTTEKTYPPLSLDEERVLLEKVPFYVGLTTAERLVFQSEVQVFLDEVKITGVGTDVTLEDRLLIAASAVIPIFRFPRWRYVNLDEVLLYPSSFNRDFETEVSIRPIMGMVGTGLLAKKMILSKVALHHGFQNETDKKNTAIHEFVHLIDGLDGRFDGVPEALLEKQYVLPWLSLMADGIQKIQKKKSDINSYGGTSQVEFFAVVSEYFFERPKLFKKKHPELYKMLCQIFEVDNKQ